MSQARSYDHYIHKLVIKKGNSMCLSKFIQMDLKYSDRRFDIIVDDGN